MTRLAAVRGLQDRARGVRFRRRWGFDPPPRWADTTGYEVLLQEIESRGIDRVDGDVLEIGALLGGGTAKLCGYFSRDAAVKQVITVDVFDPSFDPTVTVQGWSMPELYASRLRGRKQREVFDEVTRGYGNLTVVVGDSTSVDIPAQRLAFAFVDGSHDPADVRADFATVWSRLSPGGIVAFHDYGGDLPDLTATLHECIGAHAGEIARVWTRQPALLFLQRL